MIERIMDKNEINNDYIVGFKKGIPIGIGYISVSLTFGMIAVRGGLDILSATAISMTNLTSAGQFAGIDMILNQAMYMEIALTTFIINIRYALMSFALSQKFENMHIFKRLILAFGITDETYAIAALEEGKLSYKFMLGLITCPYIGWTLGTIIGAVSTKFMSAELSDALGIALYGMFIAIIIPTSKKDKSVLKAIIISSILSFIFFYTPVLKSISGGFTIIICSVVAALIMAKVAPIKEEK